MTKLQIEQKYGIHIADDSYYNPFKHKFIKMYRIYSADGCPWENGLKTIKDVERECKTWEREILAIKCGTEDTE